MKPFYQSSTQTFLSTCIILILFCGSLQAQISFENQTALKLQKQGVHSGVAMGVADMNGDGLDDIVRLDNARMLWIDYQMVGKDTLQSTNYGSLAFSDEWTLTIGDVNNDGINEIMTAGYYDQVKIFTYDSTSSKYVSYSLPGDDIFAQGSNLADINNDGFLDAFVCHDDGASRIWSNNGDGTFAMGDAMINLATVPVSDNSGNYGSVWTDFDHDGDIDLYIAKCRQGVGDPRDPRRINALYVNDGNNNYSEQAEEYGLKIGYQSWTAEFQDIDNDGDFDCFITNHDFTSQLLENDGTGHFTDITDQSGIETDGLPIQALMKDFDNDGYVDIIIAGSVSYIYHNNGDKTFSLVPNVFGTEDFESCAVGDINNDGFLDFYAGYAQVFNNPSSIDDAVWINEGNNNNYLKVQLEGTESNHNGVGAKIEIFGPWGRQIREVRSGESYGISNSLTQHFGLGQNTEIDLIQVSWPSGNLNVIKNPDINKQILIVETSCSLSSTPTATAQGPTTICSGSSVVLEAQGGMEYLWSTGETTQTITVTQAGTYFAFVGDDGECYEKSNGIVVIVDPDETPTVTVDGELEFCQGQSVTLTSSDGSGYMWSNGGGGQSIEVTTTGDYSVTTDGMCSSFTSTPIHVEVFDTPAAPQADDVNILVAGPVTLTSSGTLPHWYDATGTTLMGTGNTLEIPFIADDTTFLVTDVNLIGGGTLFGGPSDHMGNNLYSGNQFNGGILFDCHNPFTLKSVKVLTDTPGERTIELRDNAGDVVASIVVNIDIGESRATLDFDIEPGSYLLTTNELANVGTFGFESPRLQRTQNNVQYPIQIGDIATMTGASFSGGRYYYFYDWETVEPSVVCPSEQTTVEVSVGPVSTQSIDAIKSVKLYPNPGSGTFYLDVESAQPEPMHLRIMDTKGVVVWEEKITEQKQLHQRSLNLENLPAGMYWLQLQQTEAIYYGKLMIQ